MADGIAPIATPADRKKYPAWLVSGGYTDRLKSDSTNRGNDLSFLDSMDTVVLGDSHAGWTPCFNMPFPRASAYGLQNEASIVGARRQILDFLRGHTFRRVYLKFGQVDTDFLFYLKHVKDRFSDVALKEFVAKS